jgi:hypothetical protein
MSDSNDGISTAVAEFPDPMELAKAFTLFQIEESLMLLAESAEEEGLTPEIETALTGDSEACRSAFRTDVDHDSEVMPISIPN